MTKAGTAKLHCHSHLKTPSETIFKQVQPAKHIPTQVSKTELPESFTKRLFVNSQILSVQPNIENLGK